MNDEGTAAADPPAAPVEITSRGFAADVAPRWAVIGIFLILLVAALALARSFLMPVALAFMLTFVFSPMRRFLERAGIPAGLSALVIVGALLALLGAGGAMLSGPAAQWIESAPSIGRQLDLKLREVRDAAEGVRQAAEQVDEIAKGDPGADAPTVVVEQEGITTRLAATAPSILAQVGLTLVLLYFLLASGDMIYEKVVYVLPTFRDKRRAMRIARDIERRVSHYLFTITVINAGLGIAIGLAMWALGMPEPALFAVIGFLLNYIPFIGPIAGTALATVVGLVSLPHASQALLAGGAFAALTAIEGQFITPYWIGRSLQLNTVVVFLSVTLWAWLWSVVGMIVATPLLVSFRVLCEHIPMLEGVGHFLSARGAEQADREGGDSG